MNVLSLNRIRLATDEDKEHRLDYWARVFRAETWEELKALAERSKAVSEVAEAMYKVSAEQHNQSILRARRKYEEVHATIVNALARAEKERDAAVEERDAAVEERDEAKAEVERLKAELKALRGGTE